jgi:FIST N domain
LTAGRPRSRCFSASAHFFDSAQVLIAAVAEETGQVPLIGCIAEAVAGGAREVESEPAVSLWLAADLGPVETFAMEFVRCGSFLRVARAPQGARDLRRLLAAADLTHLLVTVPAIDRDRPGLRRPPHKQDQRLDWMRSRHQPTTAWPTSSSPAANSARTESGRTAFSQTGPVARRVSAADTGLLPVTRPGRIQVRQPRRELERL